MAIITITHSGCPFSLPSQATVHHLFLQGRERRQLKYSGVRLYHTSANSDDPQSCSWLADETESLVILLVAIWGSNHSYCNTSQRRGLQAGWHTNWVEEGLTLYCLRAFFFILMLEAAFSLVVTGSAIFVCIYTTDFRPRFPDGIPAEVTLLAE
jgi:hypothetical protein